MKYFLETSDTIVDGVGFHHFELCHILWLAAFVALAISVSIIYRRSDRKVRRHLQYAVAGLIVADEIFKMVMLTVGGNYTLSYLPLHLCSINIILIAIHVFKPSKTLDSFLYSICIPAAAVALLFPSWTKLPFLNFMHMHSFSVHILLALYPIMLTAGGDIKPRARYIPRCLVLLLGMAIPLYFFNNKFGTNYMFLREAEPGNPLYIFEQAFGHHYWGFVVIIPVVLLIMFLPVELYHLYKKKKTTAD